jgi:hypothetical protein
MDIEELLAECEVLADEVVAILPREIARHDPRSIVSAVACSLSLEHWDATRVLLANNLFPSAVALHRTQFEAVVRSIWLLTAANDGEVAKLATTLSKEAEQGAKNIAGLQEMISDIEKRGPAEAFKALARFRDNALRPINSYVHSGVHPLHRHAFGYPPALTASLLGNSNGVAVLSWMHSVNLSGRQDLQREILSIVARHPKIMPAPI